MVLDRDAPRPLGCGLLFYEVRNSALIVVGGRSEGDSDRPRSMRGGDLHWIWSPYSIYQDVDYVRRLCSVTTGLLISLFPRYTASRHTRKEMDSPTHNVFFSAGACVRVSVADESRIALLNIGETILNLLYVYLTHVKSLPSAPVIGFAAANLTLGKTLLYVIQDLFCNRCTTGHNTLSVLLTYYILPNMCASSSGTKTSPMMTDRRTTN